METRQIGLRLPRDLFDAVDQLSNDQGISRTEAIVSLLRRGLGQSADEPSPAPGEADELRSRLATVEQRLTIVERQLSNTPKTAPTQAAPPTGQALTQGQALTAAGYPGNPSNAKRDLGIQGTTPHQWLSDRGWVEFAGKWVLPLYSEDSE